MSDQQQPGGVQPTPPQAPQAPENTSGTMGSVPEEIKGWNWGAFWLNWIWGIGNQVWIGLLALVIGLIMSIILGIKGNEWAWQNRRFESIEQFKQVQRIWSYWGWAILALWVLILIGMMGLGVIGAIMGGVSGIPTD